MRVRIAILGTVLLITGVPGSGGEEPSGTDAQVQQLKRTVRELREEVRRLKLEFTQARLETVESRIAQCRTELAHAGGERKLLEDREAELSAEVAETDEHLSGNGLSDAERAQMEGIRAEQVSTRLVELRSEQEALSRRDASLREMLQREEAAAARLRQSAAAVAQESTQ